VDQGPGIRRRISTYRRSVEFRQPLLCPALGAMDLLHARSLVPTSGRGGHGGGELSGESTTVVRRFS
jgi:hypothetical protein